MTGSDECLGMALGELSVPEHRPDFHARLAERLDREPAHQRRALTGGFGVLSEWHSLRVIGRTRRRARSHQEASHP